MSNIRQLALGDLTARLTRREDGSILLSAVTPLKEYPRTILDRLEYWSLHSPQQIFIAQRRVNLSNEWHTLSYSETLLLVRKLASALIQFNLSVERPLAILSSNSIEHGLLGLAAMYLGIPYAPVSPQYSLVTTNFSKIKQVLDLVTPGVIFVDHADKYQDAINASVPKDVIIIACSGDIEGYQCLRFDNLIKTSISDKINSRFQSIQADDIAKFLFSSGSTGAPKAIINTHRMLAANQQMIVQAYPFLANAPVLVDWLPWNHTFGGNHNLGIALYNGGTYYIDDGKPVPKAFLETVRNLKEIAPTVYFNVPKGFEMLVKHLREDEELRRIFFSKLKMHFYAGAGLSQPVWDALDELAIETCGERIMILTGLGCTETAPSALFTNIDGGFAGLIGLPLPGLQVKLHKVGSKFEICFKGGSVTPGYWRNKLLTEKSFDEEGFFKSGDAVKFVDDNNPQRGLMFDGRISEDFKLNTGTWVSAGPLRAQFLNHFGPCVKDVVIVGRDYSSVGALVFPDVDYCRSNLIGKDKLISDRDILGSADVRQYFENLLRSFSQLSTGSSNKIDRMVLEERPPSIDQHEITDKGSLNASAIQDNRKDTIELMYSNSPTEKFILIQ